MPAMQPNGELRAPIVIAVALSSSANHLNAILLIPLVKIGQKMAMMA